MLDICEYSVQQEPGQECLVDDIALPGEGVSECEMTVINETEMVFETHGLNAGCVHQTRYHAVQLLWYHTDSLCVQFLADVTHPAATYGLPFPFFI